MFIDAEGNQKPEAPEERNIVGGWASQQHSAPPELRIFMKPGDYKHFVPRGLGTKVEG